MGPQRHQNSCIQLHNQQVETPGYSPGRGCDLPPYLPGWVEGLSLWRHTWRRHEYAQLHTRVPVPFSSHRITSPPVSVSPKRGHSEHSWTDFRSGACPGRGTGGCKCQGRCGAPARCAVGGLLCEGGHSSLFQPPPEWSEASWGLGSINDSLLASWSRVKCSLGVPVAGLDISQLVAWCLAPARKSDRCFDPSFSPWLGSVSQLGGNGPASLSSCSFPSFPSWVRLTAERFEKGDTVSWADRLRVWKAELVLFSSLIW